MDITTPMVKTSVYSHSVVRSTAVPKDDLNMQLTLYKNKVDWIDGPFRFCSKIQELSAKSVAFWNLLEKIK